MTNRIDMNPGFGPGSSSKHDSDAIGMHHRRHRKQVIESDPEDDLIEKASRPKYSRGPEMSSTPTYSMDTDISTLEAPTFSTLNQGPSQIMMMLRWDHPSNLIGKKVVNPILHVCDKCQHPILQYGRLTCKHVLCFDCATAQKQAGANCGRCNGKVLAVEQAGLGCIYMCAHGGSRYGPDGCRRTYLSERDLQAHKKFRHSEKVTAPAQSVPSAEAIAAATAALVQAENHSRKMRVPPPGNPPGVMPNFSQPPPPVMQQRSTNLITVPIQDNSAGNSNDYWTPTNKVPPPNMHQPPPNFYHRPPHPQGHQQPQGQHQQHPQPQNQHYAQVNTGASGSHPPPAGSYNEWSANSRTNSSGYHRR